MIKCTQFFSCLLVLACMLKASPECPNIFDLPKIKQDVEKLRHFMRGVFEEAAKKGQSIPDMIIKGSMPADLLTFVIESNACDKAECQFVPARDYLRHIQKHSNNFLNFDAEFIKADHELKDTKKDWQRVQEVFEKDYLDGLVAVK